MVLAQSSSLLESLPSLSLELAGVVLLGSAGVSAVVFIAIVLVVVVVEIYWDRVVANCWG